MKQKILVITAICAVMLMGLPRLQAEVPPEAAWMEPAKWGISHHYLAGGTLNNAYYRITDYNEWNNLVNEFDVNAYAKLAEKMGLGYVIFTITQNRGYLATTSSVYDTHSPPCPSQSVTPGCINQTGTNQADYTPTRDLVLDLAIALNTKGIKLIAYVPSHTPDRWTGSAQSPVYPDWWITDFITEKSNAWGTNVAGWWLDGYWNIRANEQSNDFPIATKIYNSMTSGNPNGVITFNHGAPQFSTADKFSNYTPGELNTLLPIPASGEVSGWAGNIAQWVGFTYLSQEDPVFAGWGQIRRNLKYDNDTVANRMVEIANAGGVSTWDVAINPNGKWTLDRLVQVQAMGNTAGTSSDATYSSLQLINNTSSEMSYTGNWTLGSGRGHGEYAQDVHYTTQNGDYFTYTFSGSSIVFATTKASDQGNVEVFIDNVSQGTFATHDANYREVQEIIFEKHNLSIGSHTLKVVKRSGTFMLVDLVASKKSGSSPLTKINNTDANIIYTGSWGTSGNRGLGDYNNDVAYTSTNNDSASYTFTGTTIKYISSKASDQGDVDVFIDNASQGTFSTHSTNRQVQQVIFSKTDLASGSHTLKLVKKTGTYMLLDALEYGTPFGAPTNQAPIANFSASTSGLGVTFTNSSSDPDGSIVGSTWIFGDGATATQTSLSHTYASAGTYSVSLTVTDNYGASDTRIQNATVTGGSSSGGCSVPARP